MADKKKEFTGQGNLTVMDGALVALIADEVRGVDPQRRSHAYMYMWSMCKLHSTALSHNHGGSW